jgi:putative tricarboxylic transport membrane protein
MGDTHIKLALPYLIGLAAAVALFVYAGQIQYSARPGQLGPDFWPKLAIGLMAIMCVFEIVKIALGARVEAQGIAETLDQEDDAEEGAVRFPGLLAGGIGLVLAYGLLVPVLGFLISTFAFLVAFMYLGRYRSHGPIWLAGLLGTLVLAVVFLKVVYVSLPRGVPPFDRVTDAVVGLF